MINRYFEEISSCKKNCYRPVQHNYRTTNQLHLSLFCRNYQRNENRADGINSNPQKIGDKIVSRNGYSGENRNEFVGQSRDKRSGNIVDGKFISHV